MTKCLLQLRLVQVRYFVKAVYQLWTYDFVFLQNWNSAVQWILEKETFFQGSAPTHKRAKIEIRWLNNWKHLLILIIFMLVDFSLINAYIVKWEAAFLVSVHQFHILPLRLQNPLLRNQFTCWEKVTDTNP